MFTPVPEQLDTVVLQGVDIVASIKSDGDDNRSAYSSTKIERVQIEERHLQTMKELSSIAPNFYQPDYGSRMTSSIYVRGFGSRIDQPVVGLNVDEIPVLNKNNYDFDFFDIQSVQIIRGAQSTLYGRNTAGGTMNITTMSPLTFQGKRLMLGYANGNALRLKASHYEALNERFGWSASVNYAHSDGFFKNKELGDYCDGGDNVTARLRMQYISSGHLSLDNILTISYVDEGGYAYRAYDASDGTLAPVAYNDPCSYRRLNVSDGFVVKRFFEGFTLSSVTGYSFTNDRMRLDNDFLPLDYFILGQYQKEHSLSQELVIKSSEDKKIKWLAGSFLFYKNLDLDAPVRFKRYGIDNLILKHVNDYYKGYRMEFRDDVFPIESKFEIPTFGAALYAQAKYSLGIFELSAGMRVDYERSIMNYDSRATMHYNVRADAVDEKQSAGATSYKEHTTIFEGRDDIDALEILPRFSITCNHERGNLYATISKGFKAGGFNTQIFSDILQKKLTDEITNASNNADASATVYNPETSWNYEIGTHWSPLDDGSLNISAAIFFIDCRNQQLTVFPKGESTGRMMSNAGRSHSYGGELSVRYSGRRLAVDASYGYTHATFREYMSGDDDYSGNFLPFAPRETLSANIAYTLPVPDTFARSLVLNVGWNGIGRIYWNEENSLAQSFYGLWSASLTWQYCNLGLSLWGKNLLNEDYGTFYFKSIGNHFFAQGKPLQVGLSLYLNM